MRGIVCSRRLSMNNCAFNIIHKEEMFEQGKVAL